MENVDTCAGNIILQMIYGECCFWYYIIISCGFSMEHSLFIEIGEENKIGPKAKYDLNGNLIVKPVVDMNPQIGVITHPGVIVQSGVNPIIDNQNMIYYQQVNQEPINSQNLIQVMQNQTQVQNQPQNNVNRDEFNNEK